MDHSQTSSAHHQTKHSIKVYNNPNSHHKVEISQTLKLGHSNQEVFCCKFNKNGENLVCGCGDGFVRIFNLQKNEITHQIKQGSQIEGKYLQDPITNVRWNPFKKEKEHTLMQEFKFETKDSTLENILMTSSNGFIKEYSFANERNTFDKAIDNPDNQLFALDLNCTGTTFATGGKDHVVRVFDNMTNELICRLSASEKHSGHSNRVQCIKFHPKNINLMWSGGWDNNIVGYDLRVQHSVSAILGPGISGDAIDIRSVDEVLIAGSYEEENPISFWDLRQTHHCMRKFDWSGGVKDSKGEWLSSTEKEKEKHVQNLAHRTAYIYGLALSQDESTIIAGGGSGMNDVRIFSYDDGQLISAIHDLPMSVLCLDVLKQPTIKDSSQLTFAFGSSDSYLRIGTLKQKSQLESSSKE